MQTRGILQKNLYDANAKILSLRNKLAELDNECDARKREGGIPTKHINDMNEKIMVSFKKTFAEVEEKINANNGEQETFQNDANRKIVSLKHNLAQLKDKFNVQKVEP
jgi:hypothetical protein